MSSVTINHTRQDLVESEASRVPAICVDLDMSAIDVNECVSQRVGAQPITPDLVKPENIRDISVYKRFADANEKEIYRGQMVEAFTTKWTELYGPEKAQEMTLQFLDLANNLDDDGAVIFGALLGKENFEQLIRQYNSALETSGSQSWIHSYVNLANHPEFLANSEVNGAFLHPLLIALVSYRVGGPIRCVDARGKDAQPISVLAQDNMLHIDNTPFNDEYKVILTWEKNKPSGPKGQNFVFLPGTHKGSRNCFVDEQRGSWSTENASIFTSRGSIDKVFEFQQEVRGSDTPMVVEATHPDLPLTTVFAAGSLVHHRYRTTSGGARSCIIVAYHKASDNPGQLVSPEHLSEIADGTNLNSFLFGQHGSGTNAQFLQALANESGAMRTVFERLNSTEVETTVVKPKARELPQAKLEEWKTTATEAPTVEELKKGENIIPLGMQLNSEEMLVMVHKMMVFDKHGPLDLILYSDSHEEIRKWARNQIREIQIGELGTRLEADWTDALEQPHESQLMSPEALQAHAYHLADVAREKRESGSEIILRPGEKISRDNAYRSVEQLLRDLGESITRCEDRQAFLSTSLFLFLASDTLMRFEEVHDPAIKEIGTMLLQNYVTTGVLVEKQIQVE